jgi:hypothetical protein
MGESTAALNASQLLLAIAPQLLAKHCRAFAQSLSSPAFPQQNAS